MRARRARPFAWIVFAPFAGACALVVRPGDGGGGSDVGGPGPDVARLDVARADGDASGGGPDAGPDAGPFACADMTCAPSQVCALRGGGGPIGPPRAPQCEDLPVGCNGAPSCACLCPESLRDGGGGIPPFGCELEGRFLQCLCRTCP